MSNHLIQVPWSWQRWQDLSIFSPEYILITFRQPSWCCHTMPATQGVCEGERDIKCVCGCGERERERVHSGSLLDVVTPWQLHRVCVREREIYSVCVWRERYIVCVWREREEYIQSAFLMLSHHASYTGCVWLCVRERERERNKEWERHTQTQRERERKRERERERESEKKHIERKIIVPCVCVLNYFFCHVLLTH